jgi:adhesin/invasin
MHAWVKQAGAVVVVAAVLGACGGSDSSSNNPVTALQKTPTASGDGQSATVAHVLTNQLRVLVTVDGTPTAGKTITWNAHQGSVNPTSAVTDDNGIAVTTWTLGTTAGAESLFATLQLATGSPLLYLATANADVVTGVQKANGDFQTAVINALFAQSLSVQAHDQFGNGVPGVAFTWTVQSGSISSDAASSSTNSQGIASMPVTAGATPGPAVMRATTAASPGTNLDFSLTVAPQPVIVNASGAGANVHFTSATNGTTNPAVDTIPTGGSIKWLNVSGAHTVASTGSPTFVSSGAIGGAGYTVVFSTAGTYTYECGIHGASMTGRIVVQ